MDDEDSWRPTETEQMDIHSCPKRTKNPPVPHKTGNAKKQCPRTNVGRQREPKKKPNHTGGHINSGNEWPISPLRHRTEPNKQKGEHSGMSATKEITP